MNAYNSFIDRVARVVFILTGTMISAMVLIIFVQVSGRFIFSRTPRWSEEFTLVLMLYTGFLGATLAYRERLHIGIHFFIEKIQPSLRKKVYFMIDFLVGLFALFMIIWGSGFSWMMRNQTLPATKISVGVSYLPIPLAGLLFLGFVIEKLIADLKKSGPGDSLPQGGE
jgi:TRAP-type transport system small permease protein